MMIMYYSLQYAVFLLGSVASMKHVRKKFKELIQGRAQYHPASDGILARLLAESTLHAHHCPRCHHHLIKILESHTKCM
jgi:hypothetical protein